MLFFFFFFIMPLCGRKPSWCNVKSKFLNNIQSFESGYLFSIIFRGFLLYLHDISTAHVPLLVPLINSGMWIHAKQNCSHYGRWITKGIKYHAHLIEIPVHKTSYSLLPNMVTKSTWTRLFDIVCISPTYHRSCQ